MIVDDVKVVLDRAAIEALPLRPDIKILLLDEGDRQAEESARRAPKLSGEGAASIRPEYMIDGDTPEVRISWDRDHYYMYFHQVGTRTLPPHPFMANTPPNWTGA